MKSPNRVVVALVASSCACIGLAAGIWQARPRLNIEVDPKNMLVTEFVTSADGQGMSRQGLIIYAMRIANTGSRPAALYSASLHHEHEGRAHESPVVPTRTTPLANSDTPSLVVDNGAGRMVLEGWNDMATALRASEELPIPAGTTIEVSAVFALDECPQCNQGLNPDQVALRVVHSSGGVTMLPLEIPAPERPSPAIVQVAADS